MEAKALVLSLILLIQACGPVFAETLDQPVSPGMLQRLAEKAREAKVKVQDFGEAALGLAGAYYEDHIQPVTASYTDWASDLKSTLWEKIKTTIDDYSPFN